MDDITKHHQHHPHDQENPTVSHERGDADVFSISKYGIGLAIGVVIVVFAMWGLFDWFYSRENDKPIEFSKQVLNQRPTQPPAPRLQAQPKVELRELRESEETYLNGYGWVDPDKGTVRLPIEQAIDVVAKKGLPSAAGAPQMLGRSRQVPSGNSSGRTLDKFAQ